MADSKVSQSGSFFQKIATTGSPVVAKTRCRRLVKATPSLSCVESASSPGGADFRLNEGGA